MERIPIWEQVFAFLQLSQECCRDTVGEPFVGGPDMIGHACRHRRGHRAPLAWRTDTSGGFQRRQWFLSSRVGKHQMLIGQRHPQLHLKPHEVLGAGIRATGQAPGTLALREVIAFGKGWRTRWNHGARGNIRILV